MICPHCHSTNRDEAKFCDECGFPLTGLIADMEAKTNGAAKASEETADGEEPQAERTVDDEEEASVAADAEDVGFDNDGDAESEEHTCDALSEAPSADSPAQAHSATTPKHPAVVLPEIDVKGLNVDEDGRPFIPGDADVDLSCEADGEASNDAADADDWEAVSEEECSSSAAGSSDDEAVDEDQAKARAFLKDRFSGFDVPADDDAFAFPSRTGEDDADKTQVIPAVSDADKTQAIPAVSDGDKTQVIDAVSASPVRWDSGGTMEMPRVGEEQTSFGGYRAPDKDLRRSHRRGRIAALIIAIVIVIGAAAAAITYSLELWGGKAVPDVEGLTQADAVMTLENDGFSVRSMDVPSDGTEGLVLLTDPAAGSRVGEGTEVVIHVAVARTVPSVVGSTQADAIKALTNAGYTRVSVVNEKSNDTEGTVLSVSPEEGSKANGSAQVTLTVAIPFTVPDVTGKTQDDATAALEAEGYVVVPSRMYTEDVPEGQVVSTDPAGGTQLNSGESVTMYVAVSRATEVTNAVYGIFWSGAQVTLDGVSYTVDSVDSVTYQGNDTAAYSITATPYTYFLGIRIELDPAVVSGTVTFNDDNSIQSSTPAISLQ